VPDNEKDQLLSNLIKIESVLAKLYTRFSTHKNFTAPVQKFWQGIAQEERLHADALNEIRKAVNDGSTAVDFDIKKEKLKEFISKITDMLKKAASDTLTDAEAYSLGAAIEIDLDESGFTKMIRTTDKKVKGLLARIENDTKKHRVILVNYSRGVR
jgi:rubrerythrin